MQEKPNNNFHTDSNNTPNALHLATEHAQEASTVGIRLQSSCTRLGLDNEPESGPLPEVSLDFIQECLAQNEEGDASLFEYLFRNCCIYDHTQKEWYLWQEHYWKCDKSAYIRLLVCGPLASVYRQASQLAAEQIEQLEQKKRALMGAAQQLSKWINQLEEECTW